MNIPEHFLHPETVELLLPGISRDYTFVHISDAHLAASFPDSPEGERKFAAERTAYWTPESGILPADALTYQLGYAKSIGADCVFLTGDAVDYCSVANIDAVRKIIRASGCDVLYVRGNHEGLKEYNALYRDLMGEDPELIVRRFDGFTVVALDDAWSKEISDAQLEILRTLDREGKPILLLLHAPLKTDTLTPEVDRVWQEHAPGFLVGLDSDPENAKEFHRFLTEEENHIAAIFAGHVHFSHIGEYAPGKLQYVAAPAFDGFCRIVKVKKS